MIWIKIKQGRRVYKLGWEGLRGGVDEIGGGLRSGVGGKKGYGWWDRLDLNFIIAQKYFILMNNKNPPTQNL